MKKKLDTIELDFKTLTNLHIRFPRGEKTWTIVDYDYPSPECKEYTVFILRRIGEKRRREVRRTIVIQTAELARVSLRHVWKEKRRMIIKFPSGRKFRVYVPRAKNPSLAFVT